MSLYFDAVSVLTGSLETGGSLKSRIYNSKWKSPAAQLYALVAEVSKYNPILKEVIDNSGILSHEQKLTPLLSLLLVHDLLLSRRGIATPPNHALRLAVERHKTRLNAEFVKCRIRRGCASVQELKASIAKEKQSLSTFSPRWVRINNAVTTLEEELKTTFSSFSPVSSLAELSTAPEKQYYIDEHIPDLLAVGPSADLITSIAYKKGRIILQDKASCLPAYLLLGNQIESWNGDIMDACAAPGNKTTHLASLLSSAGNATKGRKSRIFSLDASPTRSKVLQQMVKVAGVESRVKVLAGQDFLAINPKDSRFKDVTALLLDPSCSGSGILKREDIPQLILPKSKSSQTPASTNGSNDRKRKRKRKEDAQVKEDVSELVTTMPEEVQEPGTDSVRLEKLSNLQCIIIEHAFKFPAATRITYSTCSIHNEENESVVARALQSKVAKQRGWKTLPRDEQPDGLRGWSHRGSSARSSDTDPPGVLSDEENKACIRCWPADNEGTGGFFVAGFIRDPDLADPSFMQAAEGKHETGDDDVDDDEESWEGFSSS